MVPLGYLVEDDDIADAAVQHIASAEAGELQHDGTQLLLQLKFSSSNLKYPTVMERALQICRQHGELSKWNVLHISEADSLRAIQLCIGERMKQECGELCAQVSDVLAVHQQLQNNAIYGDVSTSTSSIVGDVGGGGDPDMVAFQRYLSASHLVDGPAVLLGLRRLQRAAGEDVCSWRQPVVVHGRPASVLERSLAALLTGDEPVAVRQVEAAEKAAERQGKKVGTGNKDGKEAGEGQEKESGEEEMKAKTAEGQDSWERIDDKATGGKEELIAELELVRTVWHCVDVKPPEGAATGAGSATDTHIRNMFSAMFRLLVNSRDELALAAACQAPGLELTGPDFLAIRRAARARDLPMYQTVVSHVRRVELGGANYQPPADCPLHGCTPPLSALVRLVHKLHDLLEEEPDPSQCCLRLLSAMKACVSRGCRLRPSALDWAVSGLRDTVREVAADCGDLTDPAVVGGPTVQLVRRLCDRLSCAAPPVTDHLSVLEDTVTSPGTPGRRPATLPSVVSLFRTPPEIVEEESNDGVGVPLEERLRRKGIARCGETPTTTKRYGAALCWLPTEDASAGGASPAQPEPTPPLVAGPTLVCSRSGTKYAAGEGVQAFRELQAADRARQQEHHITSPKSSRSKKPKRSLFDAKHPAKSVSSKPKSGASKPRNGGSKPTVAKKRKAEAVENKDILSASQACKPQQPNSQVNEKEIKAFGTKLAAKKRKTEATHDQENFPLASDAITSPSGQQPQPLKSQGAGQKKTVKGKQIKQVTGQKSIRDFFRI